MHRRDVLPNGLRVISETVPHVRSVSLGVWVATGSRHEEPHEAGLSHFIEHMVFKGTARRSAREIAEAMDCVGGVMDAFTDKEMTCFYVRILSEHVDLALDLLSDMLLHSTFDTEELEREKNVVLEEIKRHEDSPEDRVHDLFAATLWPNHPLGAPVIGNWEAVSAFSPQTLRSFMGRRYRADQLLISATGNLEHEALLERVWHYFGSVEPGGEAWRPAAAVGEAQRTALHRDTEQVHLCVGGPGIDHASPGRYALAILDTAFGGGMSSRLFQEIRESRGLAYSIGSFYVSYHEGGLYAVYAGTSLDTFQEVLSLIHDEVAKLCRHGLRDEELERAKSQIKGALLFGLESMGDRMTRLAKTELNYGRVLSVDEVVEEIDRVSHDDVVEVARQVLRPDRLAIAAVGPVDEALLAAA